MDFGRVLQILEDHLSPPFIVPYRWVRTRDEVTFTSQRKHLRRPILLGSARRVSCSLDGRLSHCDRKESGSRSTSYVRSMNDANVLHSHHLAATDVDNDFYLVLGHYTNTPESTLAETERMVRADLQRYRIDVEIGRDQVRIVASDSPTLAPARFVGELPQAADDLARLYD